MAKLTAVLKESLEKLAEKEGMSTDAIWQKYRESHGTNALDNILSDAKSVSGSAADSAAPIAEAAVEAADSSKPALSEAISSGQRYNRAPMNEKGKKIISKDASSIRPESSPQFNPEDMSFDEFIPSKNAQPAVDNFGREGATEGAFPGTRPGATQSTQPSLSEAISSGSNLKRNLALGGAGAAGLGGAYMAMDKEPTAAKPPQKSEEVPTRENPPAEVEASKASSSFKDKKTKGLIQDVERAKSPSDYEEILKRFDKEKETIPDADKRAYETKLNELNDTLKEVKQSYDDKTNRLEWGEVAETIGNAFVQLGAGLQGYKTGVDLSGVKFNKTNWEPKLDRALAKLKQDTGLVQEEQKAAREGFSDKTKAVDKRNDSLMKGLADDYLQEKRIQAQLREAADRNKTSIDVAKIGAGSREAIADTKAASKSAMVDKGAKKEAEKRLEMFNSALADLTASQDGKLKSKERDDAARRWRDTLRKAGKEKLVNEIDKSAGDAAWVGTNYKSPQVMRLLEMQRDEAKKTVDAFGSASPGQSMGNSGTIKMRAPDGRELNVPASDVEKLEKAGAKRI